MSLAHCLLTAALFTCLSSELGTEAATKGTFDIFALHPTFLIYFYNSDINYNVASIAGMLTNLPCNITPPWKNDHVNLVLWYKDEEGKPLYRYS